MRFPQKATYWRKAGRDLYAKVRYAEPISIKVRWEYKQNLFKNADGEEIISEAVVYSKSDLEREGYLLLGTSVELSPVGVLGAFKINGISIINNLSNRRKEIKAWL